jgi:squalene-hopene/tetraprenyl-beta-curcumene cyclase
VFLVEKFIVDSSENSSLRLVLKVSTVSQLIPAFQIQREVEITTEAIHNLQLHWPDDVSLDLGKRVTEFDCLPYLFLPAFPSICFTDIRSFALAVRLFAGSIFIYDKLMDAQHQDCTTKNGLRVQAMQMESYKELYKLFGTESIFWESFHRCFAAYADACLQERKFQSGQQPWHEYTEALAIEIAMGKAGIAKAVVAGLAELSGENRWLENLTLSVDYFNIAEQMVDDLNDWKEDLRVGLPSLLLSRLIKKRLATVEELENHIPVLSRRVYYERHAEYTLTIAIEYLERALTLTQDIPDLGWYLELKNFHRYCQSLHDDICAIVNRNLEHAQRRSFELL